MPTTRHCAPGLDELLPLVEQVFVPLRNLELGFLRSDAVPKSFHHPEFFVEGKVLNLRECDHADSTTSY